jgi:hypothetical protein
MTTSLLPPLTVDEVPIDDLRPDPANPRRIGEDELDALRSGRPPPSLVRGGREGSDRGPLQRPGRERRRPVRATV